MSTNIIIEFKGGGFLIVDNPHEIEIFVSRHDIKIISYILYRGQTIDGSQVEAVKGLASGRIRYV